MPKATYVRCGEYCRYFRALQQRLPYVIPAAETERVLEYKAFGIQPRLGHGLHIALVTPVYRAVNSDVGGREGYAPVPVAYHEPGRVVAALLVVDADGGVQLGALVIRVYEYELTAQGLHFLGDDVRVVAYKDSAVEVALEYPVPAALAMRTPFMSTS